MRIRMRIHRLGGARGRCSRLDVISTRVLALLVSSFLFSSLVIKNIHSKNGKKKGEPPALWTEIKTKTPTFRSLPT